MSERRIVEIESCDECPHCQQEPWLTEPDERREFDDERWCTYDPGPDKLIDVKQGFPEWCPLQKVTNKEHA